MNILQAPNTSLEVFIISHYEGAHLIQNHCFKGAYLRILPKKRGITQINLVVFSGGTFVSNSLFSGGTFVFSGGTFVSYSLF